MDKELELEAEKYAMDSTNFKPCDEDAYFDVSVNGRRYGFIAGATTSSRVKKLENRVEELERQIKDLKDDNKRDPWDDLNKWSRENTF